MFTAFNIEIKKGDKICQLVILKVENATLIFQEELDESDRGERGFGSTGINNR